MPNWVQNEIIFENASDEKVAALIRELKLATESEGQAFDFNKIIPMPDSLNIEPGTHQDYAIAYYATDRLMKPVEQTNLAELISNHFNADWAKEVVSRLKEMIKSGAKMDWDKLYTDGKQYIFNRENYGCYDWYHWCCRYWGTKWNACEAEWSLDDGMLVFQTAWSAPFPIIEALAQKYPDLEFTHRWADEDIGNNCGQMWYSDGCGSDLVVEDERAFALDVWGYPEDYFDDEDDLDDYETKYSDVIQEDNADPEVFVIEDPETIDGGLSISDLF